MLQPRLPPDENARLASLRDLGILDSPPEERFDRITRVAASVFDVPIALVSLVDANRQWFKSCVGLEARETGREISFCGHAILGSEALVIENALEDPRFADNPLVTGPPHIRFYAGHPLDDGHGRKLGTLCIIDRVPRTLDDRQVETLRELADWTREELSSIGLERAMLALEAARARTEAITETVVDGLITIDADGVVRSFNAAAEGIFGYARTEVIGENVSMLMPEPHRSTHDGYLTRYLDTGKAHVVGIGREVAGRRKDGTEFPVDLAVSETPSGDDRIFIGVVRDITSRKRAAEALGQLAAIVESTDASIMSMDLDGTVLTWNAGSESLYGWRADEIVGRHISVIAADDRKHEARENAARALADGRAAYETVRQRKDGSAVDVAVVLSPVRDAGGAIVGLSGVARDISDRTRAERKLAEQTERLRQSEALYRSVISAMEEGVVVHGEDGAIVACNESAERILGLTADQITGRTSTDPRWRAVDADGAPFVGGNHPAMVALSTGEPSSGVLMGIHRPNGDLRWISINARPLIRTGASRPQGVVASFADVTDQLAVERMKSEFVSMVSHELRTPLTSVRGALGLLASGSMGDLPEKPRRMLEIAVSNTDRLIRLINDILDIERIESGTTSLTKHEVDSTALVRQASEAMEPLAERAGVRLHVESAGTQLWVDADRIVQTLTNLIGNAIKYSPPGGSIRVSEQVEGDLAVFRVADDGRGIPADKLEAVFDRFQQVDASDAREKGGTGLGLPISRGIVEQHGGRIWVESVPGGGSTFTFTLPILAKPASMESIAGPSRDGSRETTVLLCDDDGSLRQIVRALLEEHGYGVLTAASGAEALGLVRARRPDVILLDLQMPGLSGWETLAELRRDDASADIPVVICSGTPPGAQPPETGGVGADVGWVIKPVESNLLVEALERAISLGRRIDSVLLVEDDLDLAGVLTELLDRRRVQVTHVQSVASAIGALETGTHDLVILDLGLSDGDGGAVADRLRLRERSTPVPLVVYTARDLDDAERDQLGGGTTRFLTKSRVSPDEVARRVARLLRSVLPDPGTGE